MLAILCLGTDRTGYLKTVDVLISIRNVDNRSKQDTSVHQWFDSPTVSEGAVS
jgi:hypothetical protein